MCPNCGIIADETDLHCDGQAHIARSGVDANDDELENYLFMRHNQKVYTLNDGDMFMGVENGLMLRDAQPL